MVKQENSYYGFGMLLPNSPVATPATPNKQLYNGGSERQNDFSNLPDYQQTFFRNYDAALGRWVAVDPEAEKSESLNIYHYSNNNPIMFNDKLGNIESPGGGIRIYTAGIDDISVAEVILNVLEYGGVITVDEGGGVSFDPVNTNYGRVYNVDDFGNITNTGVNTNFEQDRLVACNGDRFYVDPLNIDLGARIHDNNNDNKDYQFDYWNVYNTSAGKDLFFFLARETNVEWSFVIGIHNSYLATSYSPEAEYGGFRLIERALFNYGADEITYTIHSHPDDGRQHAPDGRYGPSGYYIGDPATGYDKNGKLLRSDRTSTVLIHNAYPSSNINWQVFDVFTNQIFNFNYNLNPEPSWNYTPPDPNAFFPSYNLGGSPTFYNYDH